MELSALYKDEIIINEKLKNDILSRIPKGYSNLEKAIFIYYELCKKLQYSLDFYINKISTTQYFKNPENLKYVNGEDNNEVVCFTFNAIFAKLLQLANICDKNPLLQIRFTDNGTFSSNHYDLRLIIDGNAFSVDATFGVLDYNDLVLSKYSSYTLEGWEPVPGLTPKVDSILTRKIARAVKKVQSDNAKLNENVKEYLRAKLLDDSYQNYSLDDRVKMFMSALNFCPEYSIFSFNYLLKLKRKFFTPEELGKNKQEKTNIDLVFSKTTNDEFEAYLFYNNLGYIPDVGCENFDALKIWRFSVKNRNLEYLTIDNLNELISKGTFIPRGDTDDLYNFKLTQPGKPHLTPIINNNSPKREIIGYRRTYLSDGHTEDLTIEEAQGLQPVNVASSIIFKK